ncbi:hypothetical protein [Sphingobacterium siyangense]|uniref:hypothetical protein n=1 Tax=Sphingobacterium siyangense TaxID=459529 RepID=UPI003C71BA03
MMRKIVVQTEGIHSRTQQIVQAYKTAIKRGILRYNDKILSISGFAKNYGYSRDTVEKAYKILKDEGFIVVSTTIGFFISHRERTPKIRVLLIFNKISSYKKIVFEAILDGLQKGTIVDLQIHHYDPKILTEIIEKNLNKYHYYVIMPHFFHGAKKKDYLKSISRIPSEQLILVDKDLPEIKGNYSAIYQDFHLDIEDTLRNNNHLLKKYTSIAVILPPESHHPMEIIDGVQRFCEEMGMDCKIFSTAKSLDTLSFRTIYLILTEEELAYVLKKSRSEGLILGNDIGIISFNESDLKDYLGITVVTTDFGQMGKDVAKVITSNTQIRHRNKFNFIQRQSL